MNSKTGIIMISAFCAMVVPLSASTFGNFTYTDNGTTITITGYPRNATGVVDIPATIAGKPVTTIGYNAFSNCTSLTSVTIPSSVTTIASNAFENCFSLTSVTIPSGVTSIEHATFNNCTSLTSVTIPTDVTSIGSGAFANCTNLTSVTIPSGVIVLGISAFQYCTSLTSVTIPSSVSFVGNDTFSGCSGLTNVSLQEGVTAIGDYAFEQCSLTNITIPSSVTVIGDRAFQVCTSLTSATFLGNAPRMQTYVFDSHPKEFTIYYTDGRTGYTTPLWDGHPIVAISAAPDIQVQQPAGTSLVDGTSKKTFGTVVIGVTSTAKTFTVTNTGLSDLKGLVITLDGSNGTDFNLTPFNKSTLPPGGKASFKVSFTPTATGTRRAAVHITSNDADEAPFDIQLGGMGVAP